MKFKRSLVWITCLSVYGISIADEIEIKATDVDVTAKKFEPTGYYVNKSSSATRTDTPIKDVPQSIHIIPRELIDDQINISASETLKNVSSVVTNDQFVTPAWESTRIRGFAAEQLIDGFTQYYNTGDRESLVNVQALEVLKGSNAVLYGGGSGSPVGGVVNIVSKLPTKKASSEFGIKIGSHNFSQPYFDVNQPISDNVLVRVTGEYTNADSNVDVINQKRYNINPAITFTNNDDTSLTFQGKFSKWNQQEYQGLPATGTVTGNFRIKDNLFIGNKDIPNSSSEYKGIWATLDHKINDQWSFNFKTRYSESDFDEKVQSIAGSDGFAANTAISGSNWFLYDVYLYQKQFEKTALANTTYKIDLGNSKNTVLFGIDYSELEDKGFMTAGASPALVDLMNPSFTNSYQQPEKSLFTTYLDGALKNETYGAYAQIQSDLYKRLHLLAGLRDAHVKVTYDEYSIGMSQQTEKHDLLPKVGAVFDLNEYVSFFAGYSEGLRGQPWSIFAASAKPEPAKSRGSEAGLKFNFNDTLNGQLAFYELNRSNVVVGYPSLPNGEQKSKGFDVDLTWRPSYSWKILSNYSYTDAEFNKDASSTVHAGNKLAGIPKNSARVWLNYSFPQEMLSGLSAGAGAYWQSEVYVNDANFYKADSFHTVDAAINYQTQKYNLGLTVKNLTREDYYQFYNYFGGRVRPDNGTTAYLNFSVKF
jgi:iron complex outermembrane receptor protein